MPCARRPSSACAADVALAPWVVRDYVVAEHRGYSREAIGGGWKEYAVQLESRESVLKTQSVSLSLVLMRSDIDGLLG